MRPFLWDYVNGLNSFRADCESEANVKSWIGGNGVALLLATSVVTAQNRILVLEGGTLIDGTGAAPVADAVVVVEGNRITAVGRREQVSVPPNANVIRLNGRTILPGLIDTHVQPDRLAPADVPALWRDDDYRPSQRHRVGVSRSARR